MTISSTNTVSPANIRHASGKTKIGVTATSNSMMGDYYVEWSLIFPAPHAETFTTNFKVTVGGCIVTSYALTGCTSLADYTVLDPTRTDSCVMIT
jgi:hypothetical protein